MSYIILSYHIIVGQPTACTPLMPVPHLWYQDGSLHQNLDLKENQDKVLTKHLTITHNDSKIVLLCLCATSCVHAFFRMTSLVAARYFARRKCEAVPSPSCTVSLKVEVWLNCTPVFGRVSLSECRMRSATHLTRNATKIKKSFKSPWPKAALKRILWQSGGTCLEKVPKHPKLTLKNSANLQNKNTPIGKLSKIVLTVTRPWNKLGLFPTFSIFPCLGLYPHYWWCSRVMDLSEAAFQLFGGWENEHQRPTGSGPPTNTREVMIEEGRSSAVW